MQNQRNSFLLLLSWLFLLSWSSAQVLSPEAQQALAKGAQAAAQALATYDEQLLDKPLWREAINYGVQAQQLAPNSKEPYRFLGQVYSTVKWYSRAWDAWKRYLELGGAPNVQTDRYIVEASAWLGNSSFENKQYQDAIKYYSALQEVDPNSEEANQHLALSYIALESPREAQPYLERLAQAHPDNPEYATLYKNTTRTITYGVEAVAAFDEGMSLYNGGRKDEALFAFRRATQANETFQDAFIYAGRTSLELGLADEAVGYWQRALQLDPNNTEARESLALAEGQNRYGAGAFSAFQQGLALYQQDRQDEARQSFLSAVSQNSRYEEAWAYLGQIANEQQDYQGAITYYTSALSLSPANNQYTAAIQQAQQVIDTQAAETAQLAQAEAEQQAEAERQAEAARQEAQKAEAARLEAERVAQEQAAQAEAAQTATPIEEPAPESVVAVEPEPAPEPALEPTPPVVQTQEPTGAETPVLEASVAGGSEPQVAELPVAEPPVAEPPVVEPPVAEAPVPEPESSPITSGPIVLLDVNYTHKKPDEGGSGAFSFFKSPQTLAGDISNFAAGTIYQRVQVLNKPSDNEVHYQLCLVNGDDISVGPACSALGNLAFSSPGTYESEQAVTSLSNYNGVNWKRGLTEVMLVLKDAAGNSLDDRYSYRSDTEAPDLNQYYPMEVRYTAILVPEGGNFPGWP